MKIHKIDFRSPIPAFGGLPFLQLLKRWILFKMMSKQQFSRFAQRVLGNNRVRILAAKRFIRPFFQVFAGGENLHDCSSSFDMLAKRGIGAIPDYSIEGAESEVIFDATVQELCEVAKHPHVNVAFAVFKITGIAPLDTLTRLNEKLVTQQPFTESEKKAWLSILHRAEQVCAEAAANGRMVMIDAEESWIQDAIDEIALMMMRQYNQKKVVVLNTYQMYRVGGLLRLKQHFEALTSAGLFFGAKIVRGAYMEKERERAEQMGYASPIHPNKKATDSEYDQSLRFCIENIEKMVIVAGTHNEASNLHLSELLQEYNLLQHDKRVWFSQLYGMGDHISCALAQAGYHVAKYLPYGSVEELLPYLIRRANENTSAKGISSRELQMLNAELRRRFVGMWAVGY